MSIKPPVMLTEKLNEQIQALLLRKNELILSRDEIAERLRMIEQVINENAALEQKTKEQVAESVDLFLEEWKKIHDYYPEVRLGILQRTVEMITPDEKGKKK